MSEEECCGEVKGDYNGYKEHGGAEGFTFGPREVGDVGVVHEPVG